MKSEKLEKILLFLTVLFLPTQLGKHFWPEFSFVYSLPIDYLSPTVYFWDLLVALLVVVWLISRGEINRSALNLFLIFILTQAISLIGGDGVKIGHGLVRLEQYLICGLLGVYLASNSLAQLKNTIFWALTIGILGESVLAILQFLNGHTIGFWILGERNFSLSTPGIAKFDFQGIQFLRPYGTFPHPNVLAAFMVTSSLILRLRRTQPVTFFLAGLAVLSTASRMATVVGLVTALFLLKGKERILILVAVILLLPVLYTRFSSAFNFDALSLIRREEQATIALNLWTAHPLLGVGLNSFIPAASDQLLAGPSRFLQPVHNIFLLALSETGLIGLVGLIGFTGYPIFKLFKSRIRNRESRALLLVWLVIAFLGLSDHYFLTLPQGYRLLFLVWGLSFMEK